MLKYYLEKLLQIYKREIYRKKLNKKIHLTKLLKR